LVSVEITGIAVVVEEEGSRLGSTEFPGCVPAESVVFMAVLDVIEVRVGVVVRGSGTCLSKT
jgi:hypothetical protein